MWGRFFLSHHRGNELHRCYAVRGKFFCARCVGLYPVLLLALTAQFVFHAPQKEMAVERWIALWLSLPAMIDWMLGQFWPHAFSNAWRTFTGGLLGLALGRMLYIHMREPFPMGLCWQLLAGLVAVLLVCLLKWAKLAGSLRGPDEKG
jgi:uncharacterized membrane protein